MDFGLPTQVSRNILPLGGRQPTVIASTLSAEADFANWGKKKVFGTVNI